MSEPAPETIRPDNEQTRIVSEEEKVLARVQKHLENRETRRSSTPLIDYDKELITLRDAINEARLEDIPPLLEEMERLQGVAARRAEVTESHIDPKSPYFGRLLLREGEQKRDRTQHNRHGVQGQHQAGRRREQERGGGQGLGHREGAGSQRPLPCPGNLPVEPAVGKIVENDAEASHEK